IVKMIPISFFVISGIFIITPINDTAGTISTFRNARETLTLCTQYFACTGCLILIIIKIDNSIYKYYYMNEYKFYSFMMRGLVV
ncbi:MAG TPA: hypothetical protein DCZ10_20115, partial [Pelotomaculum sp.]|nr:hypothetical protein [Pelotomaculum sp.]